MGYSFKNPQKSNYRTILKFCSVSKVSEKLILQRIYKTEEASRVDLTGKSQHVFKKLKSTLTAGLALQSIIANHPDINEYVAMASVDVSTAFDIVNTATLIKRLEIITLPIIY